ncbi:asparagine synthase-related protein [Streptomyces paludis]|uniref:asparagine synthase-related protein n=1 Tax=Streptomyces paludis TaxID=2282738 RepID=UPI0022B14067|nr:asparagine synthase-related protein [Streptomyces paludis]
MWVAGGPGLAEVPGAVAVEACAGVRRGADTPVRAVAEAGAAVAVFGQCRASVRDLSVGLKAVRAGRWEVLTRWPGSYWVVACSPDTVFVAGDLAGVRGVFVARTGAGPVWASRAQLPAAALGAGPDLGLLAAQITMGGQQHWPDRSLFHGVREVPGGYGLLLTGEEYELVDIRGLRADRTIPEGAEDVGRALREAIEGYASLGERVSVDLSGGLDSSTVAMTAAERRPVRAVTYGGDLADPEDARLAVRVAELAGVEHIVSPGGSHTWYFSRHPPAATYGPVLSAAGAGMDADYLAPAAGFSPVHLTGHGGDVVLDSSSAAFISMVQRGHRRRARKETTLWARRQNLAPGPVWQAVKTAARAGGRGAALLRAAADLRAGQTAQAPKVWGWCRTGPAASWLTPRGRRTVADLLEESAQAYPDADAGRWEDWAALRFNGSAARDEVPLYDVLGVNPAHPFLDNSVVRACLSIPAHERRRTGAYKPLLGAARPDLPLWLTDRQSKGNFTPLLVSGLRANRDMLSGLILSSPLTETGLLDPGAVTGALNAAAAGDATAPLAALDQFVAATWWLTDGGTAC